MIRYSLDTNVFITAWNEYYHYEVCMGCWDCLHILAKNDVIFCSEIVRDEIAKKDDSLNRWLKGVESDMVKSSESETIQNSIIEILKEYPEVGEKKWASEADVWVLAHAIEAKATVVTKEMPVDEMNSKRKKLPNLCNEKNIRWIDDFTFIREVGIRFSAKLNDKKNISTFMDQDEKGNQYVHVEQDQTKLFDDEL